MDIVIILQSVIGLVLIGVILMQSQGSGLGTIGGGGGETYHTKRGVEKFLFIITIGLIIVFSVLSLFALV